MTTPTANLFRYANCSGKLHGTSWRLASGIDSGRRCFRKQNAPILIGVDDIWGTSDVYRCHNEKFPLPEDCTALVLGQPLINLEPDAPPNPKKEPLPIAWTKTWTGNRDRASKIFHFTMGSAEDFQNAGVRRLVVNAVYWGLGREESIKATHSVDIVGDYRPLKAGFNYEKLGVEPHKPDFSK